MIVDAAGYRERRRETLERQRRPRRRAALERGRAGRARADERPGAARRPRAPEGALRGRDLQRGRRARPLRGRRAARLGVDASDAEPPAARRSTPRRARARDASLELLAAERASVSSVREPARGLAASTSPTASPGSRSPSSRGARGSPTSALAPGFPGLVLAAALPDARVDLIESVGRKCEFMRRAIDAAGIAQRRASSTRAPRSWRRAADGPRGLRRGHRPRGRPALDPRRARLAAAARGRRPGRLEGPPRPRRGGRAGARRASAGDASRCEIRRGRPLRRQPPPPPPRDPQDRPDARTACRAAREWRRSARSAAG